MRNPNLLKYKCHIISDNKELTDNLKLSLHRIIDIRIELLVSKSLSESYHLLQAFHPDIIFLDLELPDSTGLQTLRSLYKAAVNIPIIVLSDESNSLIASQTLLGGAQDYILINQLDPENLLRVMRYAMNRKKTENALRRSEQQFRLMIEKNVDPILIVNSDGKINFANQAAQDYIRKEEQELIGTDFGIPSVRKRAVEIEVIPKNGKPRIAELRGIKILWQDQDAVLATMRDITDRKKYEEEMKLKIQSLESENEELKKSLEDLRKQIGANGYDKSKESIQNAVSARLHDLKQPLSLILGKIELYKYKNYSDSLQRKFVHDIEKSANQLASRIKQCSCHKSLSESNPNVPDLRSVNHSNMHILLVDDFDEDYEHIKKLLDDFKNRFLTRAESVREAIAMLTQFKYDLILLDYDFPDQNGLDLLKHLQENNINIPVIMISGQGNEVIATRSIQFGAYDYLPKSVIHKRSLQRSINNALEKFRIKCELNESRKLIIERSLRDDLTHLYNRRYFGDALKREIIRSERYNHNLVLAMIDLDFFKKVNDNYGHQAGDLVLREISDILKCSTRESDLICRYGGEEFVCIMPETELATACKVCERLRKTIRGHTVNYNNSSIKISISIGLVDLVSLHEKTADVLVSCADKALYRAKQLGRDRVVEYTDLFELIPAV